MLLFFSAFVLLCVIQLYGFARKGDASQVITFLAPLSSIAINISFSWSFHLHCDLRPSLDRSSLDRLVFDKSAGHIFHSEKKETVGFQEETVKRR